VATDPATTTLPAVATDPAIAILPVVATDPATARSQRIPSLTDQAASTVNPRLADTLRTNSGVAPTPPAGNTTELNMAGYRSNPSWA